MGIRFEVTKGSGRATCKICDEVINENLKQVTAYGYQSQGSVHLDCLNDVI